MGAELNLPSANTAVHKYLPQFLAYSIKRDQSPNGNRAYYQGQAEEYFDRMFAGASFLDLYNESNLLWRLGLDYTSWFKSFLDDEGRLQPDKAMLILEELQRRQGLLDEGDDWNEREYFEQRFQELVELLRAAIDAGEPIECSI